MYLLFEKHWHCTKSTHKFTNTLHENFWWLWCVLCVWCSFLHWHCDCIETFRCLKDNCTWTRKTLERNVFPFNVISNLHCIYIPRVSVLSCSLSAAQTPNTISSLSIFLSFGIYIFPDCSGHHSQPPSNTVLASLSFARNGFACMCMRLSVIPDFDRSADVCATNNVRVHVPFDVYQKPKMRSIQFKTINITPSLSRKPLAIVAKWNNINHLLWRLHQTECTDNKPSLCIVNCDLKNDEYNE